MTNSLSEKDANDVIEGLLHTIRKGIDKSKIGSAAIRVSDIADRFITVKKAGGTPDTYCKIAEATLKYGIATDLRIDGKGDMILSFRYARLDDRPPSPEICSARWKMIQIGQFEEVEIDSLNQKEAEKILKTTIEKPKEEFIQAPRIDFITLTDHEIHFMQRINDVIESTKIFEDIHTISIYATESSPAESSIHMADIITDGFTLRLVTESIFFSIDPTGRIFKLYIPLK